MAIKILITIRGFKLDGTNKFNLPYIAISNNHQKKEKDFYSIPFLEAIGKLEAYGYNSKNDFGYCFYPSPSLPLPQGVGIYDYLHKVIENIQSNFQLFLDLLWYIEDNNANINDATGMLEGTLLGFPIINAANYNPYFTANGEERITLFSRDKLNVAIKLFKKYTVVCPNMFKSGGETSVNVNGIIQGVIDYNKSNRFERANTLLHTARTIHNLLFRISLYVPIFECLFLNNEKTEIQFKLSIRIVAYVAKDKDMQAKQDVLSLLSAAYGIRSSFLHGGKVKEKAKSKNAKSKDYLKDDLIKISVEVDQLLRTIMNKILLEDSDMFNGDDAKFDSFMKELILK